MALALDSTCVRTYLSIIHGVGEVLVRMYVCITECNKTYASMHDLFSICAMSICYLFNSCLVSFF